MTASIRELAEAAGITRTVTAKDETMISLHAVRRRYALAASAALVASLLAIPLAVAGGHAGPDGDRDSHRGTLVLTSTNDPGTNQVIVFRLQTGPAPALSFVQSLPAGGRGGAGGNGGALQFQHGLGAVANYGSNSVGQLERTGDRIGLRRVIHLAPGCVKPDSVAIAHGHLFVVGATCAESHSWPSGALDGAVVRLADPSAAQIAVGGTWGAVAFTSGALMQTELTSDGALSGAAASVTLPATANAVPLGAAFWGNVLGFTPAHSADSFAIVDADRSVHPIAGPTPPYPANAPCWVAKGPGNVWYTGNTPDHSISIFFSDDHGGAFYESVPVPGAPTDLAVSRDQKWLATIYTADDNAYVAVFSINAYGGLTLAAASAPIGVASFNGVAFSQ